MERLADPLTPVGEILKRVPSKQLMAVYKIGAFAGVDQFLQLIAAARGKLKKGGIVDVEVGCCALVEVASMCGGIAWEHSCNYGCQTLSLSSV